MEVYEFFYFFLQNELLVNSLPREVLFLKSWFSSTAATKEQLSLLKEYEEKVYEEDPELLHCNTPSFIEVGQRTHLPLAMIHYIYTKVSTQNFIYSHSHSCSFSFLISFNFIFDFISVLQF
jgi:hypothetical protein